MEVANSVGSKVSSAISTAKSYADSAVKPFNDFINGFNDKINGILKPILDKINNLPKDLLTQALEQAKNHFKGILDNFKSGIDTIKGTINGILSNINSLNSFKTDTNNRLTNLENSINTFGRLYVTQTSFNTFKSDVDRRIKLLNTAVNSINTDLKAAFQQFNLSISDMSNKVVNAINSMSVNLGNLLIPINDKLNSISKLLTDINIDKIVSAINSMSVRLGNLLVPINDKLLSINNKLNDVITLLSDLNSENGLLSKISKLINNAALFSKLDAIKNSIDNLAKKDIFDNTIFKALEKFFAANKINEISDILNKIHDFLLNTLLEIMNTLSDNVMYIRFFFDNTFGSLVKIEKIVNSIASKFDDLIKTVKEIELPKEENNTTVNEAAETNIWDVLKESLKTLAEFIKNPAKIIELLINFIKDLIVPKDINFFSNFQSEVSNNFNSKMPFVNQAKNSFTAAFNSPKQFNDLNINFNFIKFSGSLTLPLHYLNDFGKIGKPYITGFLVFSFLISMYGWLISRGTKLNDN